MTTQKHRAAIVYDYDGTLAPGNVQEHSLLPEVLEVDKDQFWREVRRQRNHYDADEILVYMRLLLERAQEKGRAITADMLKAQGEKTPLFNGVDGWFARINDHAAARGLVLEHYIVSSGNEEMIRGCRVAAEFNAIFGSKFHYNGQQEAIWPAVAINYTTKTQYLFRINKGILNHADNEAVNRWIPMRERAIPFERMVYLGDGDTDIPSMKMVRHQGGYSVAVFDQDKWIQPSTQGKVHKLISEDRANYVAAADYSQGSQLDVTVRGIIGRIARECGYREAQ